MKWQASALSLNPGPVPVKWRNATGWGMERIFTDGSVYVGHDILSLNTITEHHTWMLWLHSVSHVLGGVLAEPYL